jgi:DNA-binding XRE family transcriptional regulator
VNDPSTSPDQIRRLLVIYRADKNLTLRQLAKKIGGMTGATIGNIERGAVMPTRKTWLRIERFLSREGFIKKSEAA